MLVFWVGGDYYSVRVRDMFCRFFWKQLWAYRNCIERIEIAH